MRHAIYKLTSILTILFTITFGYCQGMLYELDTVTSGSTPGGTAPWITATFSDAGGGNVNLDLSSANLTGPEYISLWYFNFDPTENVNDLVFTRVGVAPPDDPTISTSADGYTLTTGYYDIEFNFGVDFKKNNTMTYEISSTVSLTPSMFYFTNTTGNLNTEAEIKKIGGSGTGTIAAPAPEPKTYLMMATLIAFLMFIRHIKEKKKLNNTS